MEIFLDGGKELGACHVQVVLAIVAVSVLPVVFEIAAARRNSKAGEGGDSVSATTL